MIPQPFIPAGLAQCPCDFPWIDIENYIGPVEEITPVILRLGNKTTFGVQALCAGVMLWGASRLQAFAEARHNFELAEAAFAGMFGPEMIDLHAGPRQKVPEGPPAVAAMIGLNKHLDRALRAEDWWNRWAQPVFDLSHMVHLVWHIMPVAYRPALDAWLTEAVRRVDLVAPKPGTAQRDIEEFASRQDFFAYNAPHRGQPLPPAILDTTRAFDPAAIPTQVAAFRAGLDPGQNRYLRSAVSK
jgi:hypothetical protein